MSAATPHAGVRVKRRTPFVIIESQTVRNTSLRYCDLGLLTFLLDQTEGWQVRSEQLSRGEGREGRDAVRKMLHRLAAAGHYRLERRRLLNGKTVMGTAISDHPVEQWAADYVTFGEKLDIPVVEQEDRSFRVTYPDGTLGSDGFDAPGQDEDAELPAEDDEAQDEPPAVDEEEEPPAAAPDTAPRPAAAKKTATRKAPAEKKAEQEEKAQQKAAEKALLDDDADVVAKWWWEQAEKHFGAYVGAQNGYVAMRNQIRRALVKGYTKRECAKALQQARKHWPSAQQWQEALGIVTNHIQPSGRGGRVPYSDASTWGSGDGAPSSMPGTPSIPPQSTPVDDTDDATFGVIERP
jgi:hypothetical protein